MKEKIRKVLNLLEEKEYLVIGIFVIVVSMIYIVMHGNIRKENIDDPWVLAWVYNFSTSGVERDICFMLGKAGSGVSLFFKIFAYLYGAVLNIFGWKLTNAYWLSTVLIWSAFGFWYLIFRELKISKSISIIIVFGCMILEPYLFIGNLARADALGFFFTALAFLFFIKQRYILSGVFCILAFETHPMGIMSLVYIGSYVLAERKYFLSDIKKLIKDVFKYIVGIALGVLIYLMLHGHNLGDFMSFVGPMRGTVKDNFIIAYFFKEKYMRHLPELVLIIVSFGIYIKMKEYKKYMILNYLMFFTVFASVIINRDISLYIVYLYPMFMAMIVLAFNGLKAKNLVPIGLLCLMLPQYIVAYRMYSGYDINTYIETLQDKVKIDKNVNTAVIGNANSWFAFKEFAWHEYSTINYGDFDSYDKLYIIENENYINYTVGRQEQWKKINAKYPSKQIDEFKLNGETVRIRVYERISNKK